jgi:hypothetical protein
MNINQWLKNHPVSCKYGAPLGDNGERGDPDYPYKFYLQRIRFVDGDYDPAGTYWGGGCGTQPLWGFMGEADEVLVRGFVRAYTRSAAKIYVSKQYPNVRFFR